MKAFFTPVIRGQYVDEATVPLADKSWQDVRELALKFHDEEHVSVMMDCHGYIDIKTSDGKIRYIQE